MSAIVQLRINKDEALVFGVVVGCDLYQEWLLPWWWGHYSTHNLFPVAFVDMGMSQEGISWCKERGIYIKLPQITYQEPHKLSSWEKRYGDLIWNVRAAWLKKPFALLHSPFSLNVWLDLDCQIQGSLEPLFNLFFLFKGELALVRDRQDLEFLPSETPYNSGVIAFRQKSSFISHWIDAIKSCDLPSDQEFLSRSLFLHKTEVYDLPSIYNWVGPPNKNAIIHHHSGGWGKIEILQSISSFSGIGIPKNLTS